MRAPCSKHRSLSFFFLMFLITSDIISWYFSPHTSPSLFAHHLPTRLDFLCHQRKNKDKWEEATKRQITCGSEKHLLLAEWFNEEKGCHWPGEGSWLQRCQAGPSLVVQWSGVHLTMQWTQVQSLDWEDPRCCGATKPMGHSYWAQALQVLKPEHLEPVLCNKRSLHTEEPS